MAMLTRHDPFREMVSLRDAMDRLFQEALVAPGMMLDEAAGAAPMDVRETDDAYQVHVSLPGWTPEEINISIQQNTVTISGQRKPEEPAPGEGGQGEKSRYHVRERRFAAFSRSFTFPTPVDADRAEARFENGELTLRLPKAESARPRQIRIGAGQQGQLASGGGAQEQPASGQAASKQPASGGQAPKQPAAAGSHR